MSEHSADYDAPCSRPEWHNGVCGKATIADVLDTAPRSLAYVLTPDLCCPGHCVVLDNGETLVHDVSMALAHHIVQAIERRFRPTQACAEGAAAKRLLSRIEQMVEESDYLSWTLYDIKQVLREARSFQKPDSI